MILHKTWRSKCQSTVVACCRRDTDMELHTAVVRAAQPAGQLYPLMHLLLRLQLVSGCLLLLRLNPNKTHRAATAGIPEAASHPLLMVGVFAELQMERMLDLLRKVHEVCDTNIQQFQCSWTLRHTSSIRDLNNELLQGVFSVREAEEEMRSVRAQLKEMGDRIDQQKKAWEKRDPPGAAGTTTGFIELFDRFKCRFKEIDTELDGLMAQCRIIISCRATIECGRAVASWRQAGQSTYPAQIATIYLPMTSVAVSVTLEGHVNGAGDDANEPSSPSRSSKPVFSGYGIIFILMSATLTGATYLTWIRGKGRAVEVDDEFQVVSGQEGDPPTQTPKTRAGD
ncbi:uncharacterized protein P884DRAFT_268991 [Thermothelomyces heterothallicus CBS 202.75]|uniref:uncharacterized protein n=1 Tax=Thermothelomyces heterothallicus CBS 202.75 TaxID=1149848 RepID=UPI0037442D07